MAIQIDLKKNIQIPGLEAETATLPDYVNTIRDLLHYIGGKIHFDFLDLESGDLRDYFEITVNGQDVWFYPGGLDARLANHDSVKIQIVGLGGG